MSKVNNFIHFEKCGYTIVDCNATNFDIQPIHFLLEFTSVLCITVSGTKETSVNEALVKIQKVLGDLGRYDVPVIKGACSFSISLTCHKAANEINKVISKFPNKVTIVCLGPLCNIALAIKSNNMFVKLVKKIVIVADGCSDKMWIKNYNIKVLYLSFSIYSIHHAFSDHRRVVFKFLA